MTNPTDQHQIPKVAGTLVPEVSCALSPSPQSPRLDCFRILLACFLILLTPCSASAQAVQVTATLDTNFVEIGESTTLRIYAQVAPNVRTNADRIVSWYVDVLNTNDLVATADYNSLIKPTADNAPPPISGSGTTDGAHRRGIYDTFANLPGAGVSAPVELISIPVTGDAGGTTRFEVRAGSGISALARDFLVAPLGGGEAIVGGNYSQATVTLQVRTCDLSLQISRGTGAGEPGDPLELSFATCEGYNHVVEFSDALSIPGSATTWTPLPDAPHNTGLVTTTNTVATRFFRISATR